jgi:hypothetical protein
MAKAIRGRKIEYVCTIHGLHYGERPTPDPQIQTTDGLCDICEALHNPGRIQELSIPQSVRPVIAYIGIKQEKDSEIVEWEEPKV